MIYRTPWFKVMAWIMIGCQLSGCMTIMGRQSNETNVFFDSNVEGAEVVCSGKRTYTPGSIPLRKSRDHACSATAEGYQKQIFKIKSGISGGGFGASTASNAGAWGWWTLGIGLGLGWIVDLVSGSMKDLKDVDIFIDFVPHGAVTSVGNVLEQTSGVAQTKIALVSDPKNRDEAAAPDRALVSSPKEGRLAPTPAI